MRETFTKVTEAVVHPKRARQHALGELYSAAVTQLQTGETTFFPSNISWGNHRRGVFSTTHGTVILDTTVTENNEMPDKPDKVLIGENHDYTLTRADDGKYELSYLSDESRHVPTRSVRRLKQSLIPGVSK